MLKFVKNFIKKLAEENEKSFGSGRLDCCKLNNNQKKDACLKNNKYK